MQKLVIAAGDFNLHHMDWNNHTVNPSWSATDFLEWVASNAAMYGLGSGTVTHSRGETIDLSICNASINQTSPSVT